MTQSDFSSRPKNYNQFEQDIPDYSKPVAYDAQGNPLYAHPPTGVETATEQNVVSGAGVAAVKGASGAPGGNQAIHQYVHFSRAMDPKNPEIPKEIMDRYEQSKRMYPHLNLSKGEFIINDVRRHWIGIVKIWTIALVLIFALAGLMVPLVGDSADEQMLALSLVGLGLLSFFIFCGALIATYVYRRNRFFLTNESVIQEIQVSIFNKHEQSVSLSNIEDASFYQQGIIPHLFNYGHIRLSTEGDETTYRFNYVADPKRHVAVLNNAVEAFKNGRPVELDDSTVD